MLFSNARLIFPDRIASRGSLRVEAGRITAVSTEPLRADESEEVIDVAGRFLAPGFIDLHIHGAVRRDAMEATDDAFRDICRYHASGGTTSLALTTVTTTSERILAALGAVQRYRRQAPEGAQVLGTHVEGPYFSREKPGAHPLHLIRHPHRAEYEQWLAYADDITQMTIAPELPGAPELIQEVERLGIRASGGHSDAWDDEAAEGFARGMRQVTHTFNCMSTTRKRGPFRAGGLLEFALGEPEILCECIADGCHVSPTLLRMLYQAKGPDGIALVTDAAAGAGLPENTQFRIGEIDGVVRGDVALTADGHALCSSTATMIRLVRNMVKLVGAPLYEAVRMATLSPARAQRLEKTKGILAEGADADLVILTDDLEVAATYIAGRKFV